MDPRVTAALEMIDLRRLDQARALLAEVLAAEPDHIEARVASAVAARADKQYDEAIGIARAALVLRPTTQWGLRVLALTLSDAGHHDEAWVRAARAVELGPGVAENHRMLAVVLSHSRRWPWVTGALEVIDNARRLDPDDADIHFNRGQILTQLLRLVEAGESYREALRLDPSYARATYALAINDVNANQPARGLRGLLSAAALDPSYGSAVRTTVASMVRAALTIAQFVLLGTCLLLQMCAALVAASPPSAESRGFEQSIPVTVRWSVGGVLLTVLAVVTARFITKLPVGTGRLVAGVIRDNRLLLGAIALLACGLALVVDALVLGRTIPALYAMVVIGASRLASPRSSCRG